MFEKAKITSSKFLEIKNSLVTNIRNAAEYNKNPYRPVGTDETTLKIAALESAVKSLCMLLHECTIEEDN